MPCPAVNECNGDISTVVGPAEEALWHIILRFDEKFMDYIKVILSGLTGIFLAWVVISWPVLKLISGERATGLSVFVAFFSSPILWVLAVLFSALFFAASRLGNTFFKTILFWIPTLVVSTLGVAISALLTYLFIRFKHLSSQ